MSIETTIPTHWNPYRALVVTGVWLVLVALIGFAFSGGCGGTTTPPPTTGAISLAWSLTDTTAHPATCAQLGARSVALRLRPRAGGDVVATAFACEASPGTAQLPPGVYDVTIELHAADGTPLATAPAQSGVAIVAARTTTLTPITFAASTQGTLVLSISTPATTNCQSVSANGAGITSSTLTLDGAIGCAAVTFTRQLGTIQRGTYTVNCSSPDAGLCMEKGETLTTTIAPGTYHVRATGKVSTLDCWARDDTLVVPPGGKPVVRTLGLTHVNMPGC